MFHLLTVHWVSSLTIAQAHLSPRSRSNIFNDNFSISQLEKNLSIVSWSQISNKAQIIILKYNSHNHTSLTDNYQALLTYFPAFTCS